MSAGAHRSLAGRWLVTTLGSEPVQGGVALTAHFRTDGSISGTGGLNRFSSSYWLDGRYLTIGPELLSTAIEWDPVVMEQEAAYFAALVEAHSFTVSGEVLTLSDWDGATLATFTPQPQVLAGTSWRARAYNNGRGRVVGVLPGPALTVNFDARGNVRGASGCRTYSGSYAVDGDRLRIGPLRATEMPCLDRARVMVQEHQLLIALQTTNSYRREGDSLELLTGEGALAALLTVRAPAGRDRLR